MGGRCERDIPNVDEDQCCFLEDLGSICSAVGV
jgi:hypothetical protein